jgi:hypothetical protein
MRNINFCSFNTHNEQKMTGCPELCPNINMWGRTVRKNRREQGGESPEAGTDIDAYTLWRRSPSAYLVKLLKE